MHGSSACPSHTRGPEARHSFFKGMASIHHAVIVYLKVGCAGKQRLMGVLSRIMIRSSKAGVTESRLLPPCTKSVVRLPFDSQHQVRSPLLTIPELVHFCSRFTRPVRASSAMPADYLPYLHILSRPGWLRNISQRGCVQVSYNALVEIVLRNLLLADWFDEGHVESILNHKRSKFAAELLSNMRLACSVAGQCNLEVCTPAVVAICTIRQPEWDQLSCPVSRIHFWGCTNPPEVLIHIHTMHRSLSAKPVSVSVKPRPGHMLTERSVLQPNIEDVLETLQILAKDHKLPVPEGPATCELHVPYQHALSRVELALRNGGMCDACSAHTRMPLVAPCSHLLCVDCAALSSKACCVCSAEYQQQAIDDPSRCALDVRLPTQHECIAPQGHVAVWLGSFCNA